MHFRNKQILVGVFLVLLLVLAITLSPGLLKPSQGKNGDSASAQVGLDAATATPGTELAIQTPSATVAKSTPTPTKTSTPRPTATPTKVATTMSSGSPIPDVSSQRSMLLLSPVRDQKDDALLGLLTKDLSGAGGDYAIAVKNLKTGQVAIVNGEQTFEAASLFKLSVMTETFKKRATQSLDFTEVLTVSEKAASFDLGVYKHQVGEPVTVTRALTDMITLSDNVFANVLLDRVGSWDVNKTMSSYGLKKTNISPEGLTTCASDLLKYFELLATGQILDPQSDLEMIDILLQQKVNDRLPYLLPKGIPVAHKTGNLDGVSHDAGIVYAPNGAYVFIALSQSLPDNVEGAKLIAKLSRDVYQYFGNSVN